ncbi:MAG: ATP-dependent Clp protease adaptor ClpS [Treponema sp.]|jgi:ATP-dependent Clp protease adaptor protein ClpS|nr:ATP-dependent Clp protease adaptor ClpS [Treponema sp.]
MSVREKRGTATVVKKEEKLKEPEEFKIVLLNDHYTTMEFVVEILILVFHKARDEANRIMMKVHLSGRGTVGIYPWDIAHTKVNQVHLLARKHGYPLRCIIEPL